MALPQWLYIIALGIIIYIVTLTPPFPSSWTKSIQAIAGLFVVIGLVLFLLKFLGAH